MDGLDDLTFDQEEDGTLVRRQIDKAVLTDGPWATVMFLYEELDRSRGAFRPPRMAVVRFQKRHGVYRKQSSFNIANEEQARRLIDVLHRWYPRLGSDPDHPAGGDPETDEST